MHLGSIPSGAAPDFKPPCLRRLSADRLNFRQLTAILTATHAERAFPSPPQLPAAPGPSAPAAVAEHRGAGTCAAADAARPAARNGTTQHCASWLAATEHVCTRASGFLVKVRVSGRTREYGYCGYDDVQLGHRPAEPMVALGRRPGQILNESPWPWLSSTTSNNSMTAIFPTTTQLTSQA